MKDFGTFDTLTDEEDTIYNRLSAIGVMLDRLDYEQNDAQQDIKMWRNKMLDDKFKVKFWLIGSLIVLCVAEVVGCKSFCGLAAAIMIILLISHSINEPFYYALLRSSQTVIGVSVAWLINVKLFPYPRKKATE